MKIVIFAHEASGERGRQLMDGIIACRLPQSLLRLRTINALKAHLRASEKSREEEILLLCAETQERLEALTGLKDLLEDRRLILVVPDEDPATLSMAHTLFPRFFTPLADRYHDLCAVIDRMAAKAGHPG